jgi:hypothetical protein
MAVMRTIGMPPLIAPQHANAAAAKVVLLTTLLVMLHPTPQALCVQSAGSQQAA